ncbi:MAG: hypothetical protein Q8Q41_02245 [bacterium]|nr:hypothetical protein [bacterium]
MVLWLTKADMGVSYKFQALGFNLNMTNRKRHIIFVVVVTVLGLVDITLGLFLKKEVLVNRETLNILSLSSGSVLLGIAMLHLLLFGKDMRGKDR